MSYEIKNENGEWVVGQPKDGEVCRKVTPTLMGNAYEEFTYFVEPESDLTIVKAEKILEIKEEAERRIKLLDWRLDRAREREALGIVGYETVNDIYQLKEDIRQWSNQLEVELMQIESVGKINDFSI
ncbi:hypothetical protein [Vibrio metschnikovii]|uniref:hypothetical protein n=1 Tax=Vibrio metschnikovii TaxID=28172 RepID=UPI002FCBB0A8|nr:hypothetical protein [Vibrio metschnikovii]